ncbi:hypothetical protein V5799_009858 [Amblyomma americanum]|uniref:ADAM10 cysteine-rich domain-containing protein n=1 Tax=Amblyomma americanum TaxID=6943 RepID=A0AAQ4F9A8_AMBAM
MNECTLTGPEYNLDQKCLIACESEGTATHHVSKVLLSNITPRTHQFEALVRPRPGSQLLILPGHCKPACHYPALKSLCGAKMQPGAMCDGTRGYCDVFHKCRRSDEQGPLTRLEQALFGGKTIKSVEDYIWAHPFLSAIYLLVFVALMALFFRCFSLHTPSNNPHKPHRKFRETLRNPKSFFLPRA